MLRYIVIFTLLIVSHAELEEKARYDNYKLFRVIPTHLKHLQFLQDLENDEDYSMWVGPSTTSRPVDIMVPPEKLLEFHTLMNITGIKFEVVIENIQTVIDEQNLNRDSSEKGFNWKQYHTLDEIYEWMDSLQEKYPDKVKVIEMGKTYENRVIKGVKLSYGPNKPGIFIEGGIHAREWISPATVTYLLNEFLTSDNPEIRRMAEAHDWYMVPSFNPDGYEYTYTGNRFWRKTRSKGGLCAGADLNRNWGYMWMGGGSSQNPCSEIYAGSKAFSEIESRSMSKYLMSIKDKLFAYISFHSYSQLLMFPYGHTTKHLDNHDEEKIMGTAAIKALASRYGTRYVTGNIAETIYIASGSSMDWVKATLKLPVTFTYELRDTGRYGFLLPPNQIIPNGEEVMDSLVAMFKEATRFGYPKPN